MANTAIKLTSSFPDLADLRAEFRGLPRSLAAKHMEPAMRKAVKPGLRELRLATPRGPTGNLKRSIKVKTKKYVKDGAAIGLVGYSVGKGSLGYHQGLVEFGTKNRQTKGRIASMFGNKYYGGKFEIINDFKARTRGRRAGARADRLAARGARLLGASLGVSSQARGIATRVTAARQKQAKYEAKARKLRTKPRPPKAFFKSAPVGERVQLGKMPVGGRTGNPPVRTAFNKAKSEMGSVLQQQMVVQLESALRELVGRAKRGIGYKVI